MLSAYNYSEVIVYTVLLTKDVELQANSLEDQMWILVQQFGISDCIFVGRMLSRHQMYAFARNITDIGGYK